MTRRLRSGLLPWGAVLLFQFARLIAADAQSWKLAAVTSTGSKQLGSREIAAASGLAPGATIGVAELTQAANRLAQTGMFKSVAFQYQHSAGDLTVNFTVIDIEELLPVRFENFVWAADEELERYLTENVPLFHNRVPGKGEFLETIATALTKWLSSRSLPGTVMSRAHAVGMDESAEGTRIDAVGFVVVDIAMPVRAVEFENAPSLSPEERAQLSRDLVGKNYSRTGFVDGTSGRLGAIYSTKGRIRARMTLPRARLTGTNPAAPEVAVTCTVEEGLAYKVADVVWKRPVPEIDTKAIQAQVGALADPAKLHRELNAMREALTQRGYLKPSSGTDFRFHDESSTVDYLIDFDPGPLFHLAAVRFEGTPDNVRARLEKRWKMQPGDAYDPAYFDQFVKDNIGSLLGHSLKRRMTTTADNQVNLTLELH